MIEDVRLVAIAGRDATRAATRAHDLGVPSAYDDFREMIEREDLDFVDIATPPASHEEQVTAAARQGLHVLCQKPVAETAESLGRMMAACDRAGVTFAVNENARFQPWFRRMAGLLGDGTVGEPFAATFTTRARLTLPTARFEEQAYLANQPRLAIFELGVHFLDTVRYLLGEVTSVYAATRRLGPDVAGEDTALIVVNLPHTTAVIDISWAGFPAWRGPSVAWADVRIDATGGVLHLAPSGQLRVHPQTRGKQWTWGAEAILEGYRACQEDFVRSLRNNTAPETIAADQAATLELMLGAYRSAASNIVYHVSRPPGDGGRLPRDSHVRR